MKLRESGMPEEVLWETFFDIDLILDRLGIDGNVRDVVELGCGYGTFTVAVARRISGTCEAFDIEPTMVNRTQSRAAETGISNVVCRLRDVFSQGFGGGSASRDACLLFNILHCEEPVRILTEAARVVRPGGFVHVIHWRRDIDTPRGPGLDIRPDPGQIIDWALQTGQLEPAGSIVELLPWHYGIRLRRREQD